MSKDDLDKAVDRMIDENPWMKEISYKNARINELEHQLVQAGIEVSCLRAEVKRLREGIEKHREKITSDMSLVGGILRCKADENLYALIEGKEDER